MSTVYGVWEYDCLLAVFATEELALAWVDAEARRSEHRVLNVEAHSVFTEMPKLVTRYVKTGHSTASASVDWDFESYGEQWKSTLEEALNS